MKEACNSVLVWCIPLCLFVLPTACSTQQVDFRSEAKKTADMQLEQNGRRGDKIANQQINQALSYYELVDDRPGQWQANLSLANWHLTQGEDAKAEPYARQGYELAEKLNDRAMIYHSSVQLGRLVNDSSYYQQALNSAEGSLQKAVALTLLERYEEAESLFGGIDSTQESEQLGFLYYRYGKHRRMLSYVLLALESYRRADNISGIIDSLFLAAQLATSESMAIDYAQRALLSANRAGSEVRRDAIQHWIDTRVER
jgi:hypothetical protein